jgi:hypothetical protein
MRIYCPMSPFWYNGRMKSEWQYNQIIDLEYFFHQDLETDSNRLHRRDRELFLKKQNQAGSDQDPSRRDLLSFWRSKRIKADFPDSSTKSPGSIFNDSHLLVKNISVVKGLLTGFIGGFSFFTYTGTTPVNVFHFLLLFVVSQLIFVALLLGAYLLRLVMPGLKLPSFYSLLFRGMLSRIAFFIHKKWLHNMPGKKRASMGHAFGVVKTRSKIYGSLFYWPLFGLSQLFAIGFNVGLLAVTLLKISTSDLAFGWQSTLQFSSMTIHQAVKIAALPWSWFVSSSNSYPSIVEIEGSRIILKEGIYHLATGDLIAWWPFLVFCLLFYGLLLRIALLFLGKWMERRSLKKLRLDTPDCMAVSRRMRTPLVSTQADPEPDRAETWGQSTPMVEKAAVESSHILPQVVLIPDDVFTLCPPEELTPLLQRRGFDISDTYRFMIGYDEDQSLKQLLTERTWKEDEGIFILLEAWMPPLVDFLTYLKDLRKLLPERTIIHLALVGRPNTTALTMVSPQDFTIWQQKVGALGDPYLTIFSLIS